MSKVIPFIFLVAQLGACSDDQRLTSSRSFRSVEPTRETGDATEYSGDESEKPSSGMLLQCTDVQMSGPDKGAFFCSIMRDGVRMDIPAAADLEWSHRANEDLEFAFTKLEPQIGQHVIVQVRSISYQLMSKISGAMITAKVGGQYLESKTLNVKSSGSNP